MTARPDQMRANFFYAWTGELMHNRMLVLYSLALTAIAPMPGDDSLVTRFLVWLFWVSLAMAAASAPRCLRWNGENLTVAGWVWTKRIPWTAIQTFEHTDRSHAIALKFDGHPNLTLHQHGYPLEEWEAFLTHLRENYSARELVTVTADKVRA